MGSSQSQQPAPDTISHWCSKQQHELIFDSGRRDATQYLEAVDRLQQSPHVKGSDELISRAMARLRNEFVAVLRRQANYQARPASTTEWSSITDSSSTACAFRYEDYVLPESPSVDVISYLRNIAERMNSSGRLGECVKEYKSVRKLFLQTQLQKLRFEELSASCNPKRYAWDELKVKMELWIQVSKICVKILFRKEKQLCEQIFVGLGDNAAKDDCFVGTVQDFAAGLFGFVEETSLNNQPYERMETILGLYDAFLWVLPSVDVLFLSEPGEVIRNRCAETLSRVEVEVGRMLYDFENAVLHEKFSVSDDRGAVHPSTEYVMERINLIVRNTELLTKLIKSTPSLNFGDKTIPQEALGEVNSRSFLELHLILIIEVLQKNLETKSKSYQDSSLGQLFVMNNVHYIVQKIEASQELQGMIGDSYLRKLTENRKFAIDSYQALIRSKFSDCFGDKGLYITRCFKSRPSKTAVRRKLRDFNSVFEETRSLLSSWMIPDSQLQAEILVSMTSELVPAYGNFLEILKKFGSDPEMALILKDSIIYSIEDLKTILDKLSADPEVIV